MKKKIFISLLIIFTVLMRVGQSRPVQSESETEIQKAINYLKAQPDDAWASMALAAAGETEIDLEHLKSVPQDQQTATSYAKYILALVAVGQDPTTFGAENYIERLKSFYNSEQGQFGDEEMLNDDIWAILALGAIGQENLSIVQDAKDFILSHQAPGRGWGYSIEASADSNDTAAAIMALLEAGVAAEASQIKSAIAYLRSVQNDDGGFAWLPGAASDSASDAWAISAIYKLGQDPESADWVKGGNNAILHLQSLQDEDGGFWWQAEGDNKMNTAWAVIALAARHFPVYTDYNRHILRIEGQSSTIWQGFVHGGTPLDLIINASKISGYDYQIIEYPFGLYLKQTQGEVDGWMYIVNNISPTVGSADYYLNSGDEVLFYFGQWLEHGWLPTKIELTKTKSLVRAQVQYYQEDWQDLEIEGVKVKIGNTEFVSDGAGLVELSLATLEEGLYKVFAESQVIQEQGLIRSERVSLKKGEVPDDHKLGLVVEIERVDAPAEGFQPGISFSVSPDILDFGRLKPSQTSIQNFSISNGSSRIHLEAEVVGASVFQDNLQIDSHLWQHFSTQLAADEAKDFSARLDIPLNYSGEIGRQEGELILWAIKE